MEGDLIRREAVLELLYGIKDDDSIPKNYGTILDLIKKVRDISTVCLWFLLIPFFATIM